MVMFSFFLNRLFQTLIVVAPLGFACFCSHALELKTHPLAKELIKQYKSSWETGIFGSNSQIMIVVPDYNSDKHFSHIHFNKEFALTLVVARNTKWSVKEVKSNVLKIAAIYSQCSIRLSRVYIITASLPGFTPQLRTVIPTEFVSMDADQLEILLADSIPKYWPRPVVFLLDGVNKTWAYSRQTANFLSKKLNEDFSAIGGTAFVSSSVLSKEYRRDHDQSYNPIAHELGHIFDYLSANGKVHSNDSFNNLMHDDTNKLNGYLSPSMCQQFYSSPLVTPID